MSDKDYWERHARNYDASLRWVLGRPLPRMLELTSEAVRGKGRVLEVAAGTGIVTSAAEVLAAMLTSGDTSPGRETDASGSAAGAKKKTKPKSRSST